MSKMIFRKLGLFLLLASCASESENSLDYYVRDSKNFLSHLVKNDISGAIDYFHVRDSAMADGLREDLQLFRERIICFENTSYTIEFKSYQMQEGEEFNDHYPFFLRFSIACGGKEKYAHIYYDPEHHKIYFVRDYNPDDSSTEGK